MTRLLRPDSPLLWAVAGQLVDEYAASLGVSLDFQDFAHERRHLAEEYAPPHGLFLIAEADGYIGCGAFRKFSDDTCEMKRLYVRPAGRGRGTGRMIAETLMRAARQRGYRRMVLDTLPSMTGAQALYATLGFAPTAPYRFNPVAGSAFLAIDLTNTPPPTT